MSGLYTACGRRVHLLRGNAVLFAFGGHPPNGMAKSACDFTLSGLPAFIFVLLKSLSGHVIFSKFVISSMPEMLLILASMSFVRISFSVAFVCLQAHLHEHWPTVSVLLCDMLGLCALICCITSSCLPFNCALNFRSSAVIVLISTFLSFAFTMLTISEALLIFLLISVTAPEFHCKAKPK